MSEVAEILVVDDERSVREGLSAALAQAGYAARTCEGLAAARLALDERLPACVLLDIRLKDGDGLAFLEELRRARPGLPVIMATAYGDSDRTIAAMKHGAFNYVTKPFDLDVLLAALARAVRTPTAAPTPHGAGSSSRLLGQSARMLDVWKAIGRASTSDAPVLVTGETGVGKELVAHAIHQNSAQAAAPFVAVNIAALPPSLVESELFGHEKGAFTGATARREGRFEAASGGTIFLDEIGDLDLSLQTKLLRVLQDGAFERVGSHEPMRTNARVIAATSKEVSPSRSGSTLREDLFYRLSVVAIHLPPLRDRKSDIPILVASFLSRMKGPRRAVSEEAVQKLSAYAWPGNVRELLHVLERACVMSSAEVLDASDFDIPVSGSPRAAGGDDLDLRAATARLQRDFIERALVRADDNRAEAARLLGVARPQLYSMMKELGLPTERLKK